MEWESLWAVVGALVLWRLVICVAVALSLAVLIFVVVPSAAPGWMLGVVLVGLAAGMVWQARAEAPCSNRHTKESLSSPVAISGLAFAGLIWGGLLEHVTGSAFVALAILLATPFLTSPLVVGLTREALTARQLTWGALALSSAYAVLHAWVLFTSPLAT